MDETQAAVETPSMNLYAVFYKVLEKLLCFVLTSVDRRAL